MNLQEFAALKVGDKIENPMTESTGDVSEVTDKGVRVHWGQGLAQLAGFNGFVYNVNSTAWMHWRKAESGNNSETTE